MPEQVLADKSLEVIPAKDGCCVMEHYTITVLPQGIKIDALEDQLLLNVLRDAGLRADAPCGGAGTCGKCKLMADGQEILSCQTLIDGDMTVVLP